MFWSLRSMFVVGLPIVLLTLALYFTLTSRHLHEVDAIVGELAIPANISGNITYTGEVRHTNDAFFGNGTGVWKGNGNVGIKTTSPSYALHVGASARVDDALGVGMNPNNSVYKIAIKSGGPGTVPLYVQDDNSSGYLAAIDQEVTAGARLSLWNNTGTQTVFLHGGPGDSYINTSGNVGIGTTNPRTGLTIWGPNNKNGLSLYNTYDSLTTGLYSLVSVSNAIQIRRNTAAAGDFTTFTTPLFINSSDNVGINTTSPSQRLDVNGNSILRGNLNMDNGEINYVRKIQLQDWDDSSGGGDDSVRVLRRDGSWTFYNGGVRVGSYVDNNGPQLTTGQFSTAGNTFLALGGGNVGIGTTAPAQKLHIAGSVRGGGTGGSLRISTGNGYVDVGPQNASWAHFTTDRANFYFGSPVHVNGAIYKYGTSYYLDANSTSRLHAVRPNYITLSGVSTYAADTFNNQHGVMWKDSSTSTSFIGSKFEFRTPATGISYNQIYSNGTNSSMVTGHLTSLYNFHSQGAVRVSDNVWFEGSSSYGVYTKHNCCALDGWFRLVRYNAQNTYHDLAVGALFAGGAIRFDLAEIIPVDPDENLVLGEIVTADPSHNVRLRRSRKAYEGSIVGILSDVNTASMTIGGDTSPEAAIKVKDRKPIALAGRVTTVVNLESGNISIGDPITSSSKPGVGMKAIKQGTVVSKALENFDGSRVNSKGVEEIIAKLRKDLDEAKNPKPINTYPGKEGTPVSEATEVGVKTKLLTADDLNKTYTPPVNKDQVQSLERTIEALTRPLPAGHGRIISYVSVSYYDSDMYLTDTGDLKITGNGTTEKFATTKNGSVIDKMAAFAEIVVAKLRAGAIEVKKLVVDGVDVAKKLRELENKISIQTQEIKALREEIEKLKK